MSVDDDEAKRNMAMDIDQLDAIIDKFMDYARPGDTKLRPVNLTQVIEREMQGHLLGSAELMGTYQRGGRTPDRR